jgi:hypothetical protein
MGIEGLTMACLGILGKLIGTLGTEGKLGIYRPGGNTGISGEANIYRMIKSPEW